jgi:hypothetical protein
MRLVVALVVSLPVAYYADNVFYDVCVVLRSNGFEISVVQLAVVTDSISNITMTARSYVTHYPLNTTYILPAAVYYDHCRIT